MYIYIYMCTCMYIYVQHWYIYICICDVFTIVKTGDPLTKHLKFSNLKFVMAWLWLLWAETCSLNTRLQNEVLAIAV